MNRILAYLRYLLTSKGIYRAHSPFLFTLFNEVLNEKKHFYAFDRIEKVRKDLLKNEKLITVNDLGAGSRSMKSDSRKIKSIARTSLKAPKYARLLFRLCVLQRQPRVLELGSSLGITTSYLVASGADVTSVEGASSIHQIAQQVLDENDLQGRLVCASFQEFIQSIPREREYDIIFIDGHHIGEALLNYSQALLPHLSREGILIIDDINWSADMNQAWKQLKASDEFQLSLDLFELGILFRRKGMVKQDHTIRY